MGGRRIPPCGYEYVDDLSELVDGAVPESHGRQPLCTRRPAAAGGLLIVAGGLVYSAGAAVYALRHPDPAPAVFGCHEVFHLLVIAGVATRFLAISLLALPTG